MAITITNTLALSAITTLGRNQANMQTSLARLSTGFRINAAKDDPAGLIASEYLRSEIASTNAAINNAQRADHVLATAEGGLSEVSNLLISLQGLVSASANTAGLSADELAANQIEVDSVIHTISRVTGATTFAGMPLLNGSYAYRTSGGANAVRGLNIQAAHVPTGGQVVNLQVLASAQHAQLIAHGQAGGLASGVTLMLAGNKGTVSLSFTSGTHASAIAYSINELSDTTGIVASANATDVAFSSVGYGSSQYVSVQSTATSYQPQTTSGSVLTRTVGTNARVAVNSQVATADGLTIYSHTDAATFSFQLDPSLNTIGGTVQFAIVGGGAAFNIGPQINSASLFSIGLGNLDTSQLGFTPGGAAGASYALSDLLTNGKANMSSGHLEIAQQVVHAAIQSVSAMRGRIGAARAYDIQSAINTLNVKVENLSSAESQIRDADFAAEASSLARSQILAQVSQFALSAAQENQRIILKLLG